METIKVVVDIGLEVAGSVPVVGEAQAAGQVPWACQWGSAWVAETVTTSPGGLAALLGTPIRAVGPGPQGARPGPLAWQV